MTRFTDCRHCLHCKTTLALVAKKADTVTRVRRVIFCKPGLWEKKFATMQLPRFMGIPRLRRCPDYESMVG